MNKFDDVDWSQFEKGDQFTGILVVNMAGHLPVMLSVSAPELPDLEVVMQEMVDNNGPDTEDLSVEWAGIEMPAKPGIYECIFEIEDVDPGDGFSFKVVRIVSTTARFTLSPRQKTVKKTSFDKQKEAVAAGLIEESQVGAIGANVAIKW